MTSRNVRAFSQWSLVAAVLLFHTLAASAQDLSNQSIASTTAPVLFNFVTTPDIGNIGSLSADSENDIWATSVTKFRRVAFQRKHVDQIGYGES